MEYEYKNVRKILENGGSRFDYLFDCLQALDTACERKDPQYLREKLARLKSATNMITEDVEAWARRENIFERRLQ